MQREEPLETVRREMRLPANFDHRTFDDAFSAFRRLYNVAPVRASCSPDVLSRYCALYERDERRGHESVVRYENVPLVAAVLAPGTIVLEGEVDPDRMGDW